jgi:DNA-binding MarR family transcriptional regulator
VEERASTYRFGDLLALARRSWILAMSHRLLERGYEDYRVSDSIALRLLRGTPRTIGELAAMVGVTRQAARKVARGLEERGFAVTRPDPEDARKVVVELTPSGHSYAGAVVETIDLLNRYVASRVSLTALGESDVVLRASIIDEDLRRSAQRIRPPAG